MRAKLVISYDGSRFNGFARQKNDYLAKTVSNTLDEILHNIGIFSKVVGAGRTDAGVHAIRQCVAFDIPEYWTDEKKLEREISRKLPNSIQIRSCKIVSNDFHPRFGVKKRAYRYLISTGKPNPFDAPYVTFTEVIDFASVQKAVLMLNGEFDFSFFKKTGGNEKTLTRTIRTNCYKKNDLIVFYFESNGFLRSQIRMLMHFILEIANGTLSEVDFIEQLKCEKKHTSKLASPNGLYLVKVAY